MLDKSKTILKLSDFGTVAKLKSLRLRTRTGEFNKIVGTNGYIAPEVLMGESYGRQCDVWSFGCCFIEMKIGQAPWEGLDFYANMFKVCVQIINLYDYGLFYITSIITRKFCHVSEWQNNALCRLHSS